MIYFPFKHIAFKNMSYSWRNLRFVSSPIVLFSIILWISNNFYCKMVISWYTFICEIKYLFHYLFYLSFLATVI